MNELLPRRPSDGQPLLAAPPGPVDLPDLGWLLERLVDSIDGAICALVATSDGLARGFHSVHEVDAGTLSAIVSGLMSLSGGLRIFAPNEACTTELITIQTSAVVLFLVATENNGVLGVGAARTADPGVLASEMHRMTDRIGSVLGTAARHPAVSGEVGR